MIKDKISELETKGIYEMHGGIVESKYVDIAYVSNLFYISKLFASYEYCPECDLVSGMTHLIKYV